MTWTQEREETLRSMYADGVSCGKIANEIGGGITRNAVIGKVHRLGLHLRGKPERSTPYRRSSRPKIGTSRANRLQAARALSAEPPRIAAFPLPPVLDTTHMCRLEKLKDRGCRFPLWADDTPASDRFYCGDPSAKPFDGRPYCAHHARIAFTPVRRGVE